MPLVPSYIENLENYVPGKPIEEVQRELGIKNIDKLASNENPIGPSPKACLLYTSPSPRDGLLSRMPSSA